MQEFICHKRVKAAKILDIRYNPFFGSYVLDFESPSPFTGVRVTDDWFQKHLPSIGGYFILYADGYTSYSPAKAFEEGYKAA